MATASKTEQYRCAIIFRICGFFNDAVSIWDCSVERKSDWGVTNWNQLGESVRTSLKKCPDIWLLVPKETGTNLSQVICALAEIRIGRLPNTGQSVTVLAHAVGFYGSW
jgi:hypothetical protein